MAGFTKLVPEIVMSSIWNEPPDVRCVWITLLATKDENGYVRGNLLSLARTANVSVEATKHAIDVFQQPDPVSNTPDNEGRRIQAVPGGWYVLNHAIYRGKDYREHEAERKREYRRGAAKPAASTVGYVYYAGDSDAARVKIGYSKNPWTRVAEMRTALPKMQLLAVEPGDTLLESSRHAQFAVYRIEREWFSLSTEIESFIRSVRDSSKNVPDASVSVSVSDSVSDRERVQGKGRKFIPPSVEEVAAYCAERENSVNAENFVDFYTAKGWMVGKNKVKDWKACVRTWEHGDKARRVERNAKASGYYDSGEAEPWPDDYGATGAKG